MSKLFRAENFLLYIALLNMVHADPQEKSTIFLEDIYGYLMCPQKVE